MDSETYRTLTEKLLRYGYSDSTIAAHVKRDFGYTLVDGEIEYIRQRLPKGAKERTQQAMRPLFGNDRAISAPKVDPLLKALAGYHLKHSRLTTQDRMAYTAMLRHGAL